MKDAGRKNDPPRKLFRSGILPTAACILCLFFCLSPALADQININLAAQEELTSLPYIGKARAQAIVSHRRQHGPFAKLEDLLEVDSIGPKSLEAIAPYITLKNMGPSKHTISSYTLRDGQVMLLADADYYPVLTNFIKAADQRIDVAMFLFKTTASKNNKPSLLVDELIKAQKRGVLVQVLLEKSGYNESVNLENQRVADKLQNHNIKVRFDSLSKTTHSKLVIVDKRFCFVGSHNFSHSALAFNHEISLLLDNPKMAKELTDYIAAIQ